ncbi:NAD(P)(+) transhydrogenase (AB-specific), alpha subunit [Propionibacterium sp. oral taxon 192 str. F0372]|uniref:Re/Si-specific NAD(P)(+) transhydrogenase subunit alpha n=1 Tax=Propionibacterium sp. oral taxon 192 TaxID=671222 RepID=UPI0003536C48|nr:Re/Si-specific NAD(P)(+) transhydrogenase subunit alpha [Propionibacterium sp. oral taxon 192]EPH05966.1 NAD(P)(+) transhydrogenase (AB-specific), alpha subunit [Propionibacterium sp. oral taxon 192 str. F0372]
MRIGIPRESLPGENRVAATPATVEQLIKLGYEVVVESGAGARASFPDNEFEKSGATIVSTAQAWGSELVLAINEPSADEIGLMHRGSNLITFLRPRQNEKLLKALQEAGITGLSMDMVPRISRAQSMDALSSQANISGYRGIVEASYSFGRTFGGQVTAAGKVAPAKVFVIGTGVAGLAAIGAANSRGAEVYATDVRPETAEQVESMGATFLKVRSGEADQGVSSDGYAKATSDDYNARAAELYMEQATKVDIIVTTAAIPGKPSPKLITAQMVAAMKPGSVIVDMGALGGGNCELTTPGEKIVTDNGVTIIGYTDLASRLPSLASQLYGTNLVNLLKLATPGKDGQLVIDFEDEVLRNMTVTRDGEITFPPPPIQVSAAPVPVPEAKPVPGGVDPDPPKNPKPWWVSFSIVGVISVLLIALLTFAPPAFVGLFGVFALALVVGYYVVWNVTAALHTPLMSVTNAVSGIVLVGAISQLGADNMTITIIAALAVLIASINVFGGFTVTNRMLKMFRKG